MVSHLVKCLFVVVTYSFLCTNLSAQQSLSAVVLNLETNLPEENVSVRVKNSYKGAYTNSQGVFLLENIDTGSILIFDKIGFSSLQIETKFVDDIVYINPVASSLKEVVISGFSSSQLKQISADKVTLSQSDIQKLPFILGEKDVIKLIQYTPGVQQASEGQTGLLVRGGNGSMNLTQLDHIYLHNTAHLGGLFSAVNSDFVEKLEFSKSGFDALYGGRLSSVTAIQTLKSPDSTSFNGSLGLLSAKLTGNIKTSEKGTLLLSGRRTYLELFKPFSGDNNSIFGKNKNYFLYDGLAKYSLKLNSKNEISVLAYLTKDNFFDKTKARNRRLRWGNILYGANYFHEFSNILNSLTTVSNSKYKFNFSDTEFPFEYSANSSYEVVGLNHFFNWKKSNSNYKLGTAYQFTTTLPKRVNANVDGAALEILNQDNFNFSDISFFADAEFLMFPKIKVKTGLRVTGYFTEQNSLVDKETFLIFEPRLSLKYDFVENQAFKFGYQRLGQFIHQASVAAVSLPADFFVVSTNDIKPQISNQFNMGYIYEFGNFQFNSAAYYKNVNNYTEFLNGSVNNLVSNNVYEDIVVGELKSFGLESSLSAKIDKLTAQASLTLSRTLAQFEEVNNGSYFPVTFDRPININSVLHYQLSDSVELGALFLYTSGQNYTRPRDIRIISESPIINFESKNVSRYPAYHRLDLSCTYAFKTRGKWKSKLNLTIYNVYNRENPFQITFRTKGNLNDSAIEIIEERETLFPLLPSLNWIFSF